MSKKINRLKWSLKLHIKFSDSKLKLLLHVTYIDITQYSYCILVLLALFCSLAYALADTFIAFLLNSYHNFNF